MPRGGFKKPISVSHHIREYLEEHGEAYIWEMYKAYKKDLTALGPYHLCTYLSFRQYIYRLRRLNLIEFVREEAPAKEWLENRKYFRIVESKRGDNLWNNPLAGLL